MVPTRLGLTLVVVAGTAYLMAWLTRIGWLYMAVSVVMALLLVNLVLPYLNLRGLSIERRPSRGARGRGEGVFEDDVVDFQLRVTNRSMIPKVVLSLTGEYPCAPAGEEGQGTIIGVLLPGRTVVTHHKIRCYRRGVFSCPPMRVWTSAPFGLFRARRTIEAPLELTVYPRVLHLAADLHHRTVAGDSARIGRLGTHGELRGSRTFQPSDSLRNVHWRNSARSGQLMVKEFDQSSRCELRIAFNPIVDLGHGRDTTLEYAVKITAALARVSLTNGWGFRLWPRYPTSDLTTWPRVLDHLARIRPGPELAISQLLAEGATNTVAVIVVSSADTESLSQLRRIRSALRHIIVVMMEGFDRPEDASAALELSSMGLTIVPCRANHLAEAVRALGEALRSSTASNSAPMPNSGVGSRRS